MASLPNTTPPQEDSGIRHVKASDTISSGSSSGLATMSGSSGGRFLASSSSSIASSSDSSTCCSNAPTMTNNSVAKNTKEDPLYNSNSDSTLTKENSCGTMDASVVTSPPSTSMLVVNVTPSRDVGPSSSRTISTSSHTTGSGSSASFCQTTCADASIQTSDAEDDEEVIGNSLQNSPLRQSRPQTTKTFKQLATGAPPFDGGMGTLSGTPPSLTCGTSCKQLLCTPLRTIVSQNRRRYLNDGFNLDLTYITDRIIAMGYPADATEALYRNSMSHIVKFLEYYHPGHYKVFNLRGQSVYDISKFQNRVISFEMTDHHPPRLELMAPFCREVHEHLERDPRNVVAVHCKAGKGRTGVMICAYLCYINFYDSPRKNMDYYSIVRTHNNKGLTIPSQRRYVYYFHHLREKRLNYMPLKTELVGIYIEKPPKLSGTLMKGALRVRVTNSDICVFEGNDLWISSDMHDEEEQFHKRFPIMIGSDQYDPNDPKPGNDCISRRCYGWTVPVNRRVFIEGDVRVDIYHKSQIRLLNVEQDHKKVGHIWFNTMFTCSGFCGGQYIHGDEKYQYTDEHESIVKCRLRRKGTADTSSSTDDLYLSSAISSAINIRQELPGLDANHLSSSVPSSLPVQFNNRMDEQARGSISPLISSDNKDDSNLTCTSQVNKLELTPTSIKQEGKRFHRLPVKFNGLGRSRNRSPLSHESAKEWTSQDTGLFTISSSILNGKRERASVDSGDNMVKDYEVEHPGGLERHCPESTLKIVHPYEKNLPRKDIEEILKDAGRRHLISDLYNVRRLSVPKEGAVVPKSPVGRPNANGPCCLMRQEREHVTIYSALEIDRANKKKDFDLGFKVIIVTRCIDESAPFESQLSNQFIHVTRKLQSEKDKMKREKLQQHKHGSSPNLEEDKLSSFTQTGPNGDLKQDEPTGISGNLSMIPPLSAKSAPESLGKTESNMNIIPECENPLDDARKHDPHLTKYFFRQRVTSQSRHPSLHYHCPLMPINPAICGRYGCPKRGLKSFITPKPIPDDQRKELVERGQKCYKLTAADNEDSCFDDEFDPIIDLSEEENNDHGMEFGGSADFDEEQTGNAPWIPTTSTTNGRLEDSESDLSVAEMPNRSNTTVVPPYAQSKQGNQVAIIAAEDKEEEPSQTISSSSSVKNDASRDLIAQISRGDCHPKDSNWCSSTSSSCQSIPEGSEKLR